MKKDLEEMKILLEEIKELVKCLEGRENEKVA